MPLDFTVLCPKIERIINKIEKAYQEMPGLILTEDDLKCILHQKLANLSELRGPAPTQDNHIPATHVHAEVSWYGEHQRLEIKPDITILEPEHLSILHRYEPLLGRRSLIDPFIGNGSIFPSFGAPRPLPSKQFRFEGRAITFELKFARAGINPKMFRLIETDYNKIMRLFRILDRRGEGNTIFSYLIIFNKYQQRLDAGAFAEFLKNYRSSYRHKIIYKTGNVRR